MKLSIHSILQGKPVKVEDASGKIWYEQNGQKVNLGYGWLNIDETWDEVFNLITVEGAASAPYLTSDNRKDANFNEASLALIDVDNGMTIADLFSNKFYDEFGAGFYTTPSHTDEAHRFRIMHRLENPICEREQMRLLYRGLMLVYGNADTSCKDACRLFYGTKNCVLKEQRSNLLTQAAVDTLVSLIVEQDNKEIQTYDQTTYAPLSDSRKQKIIDLLKKSYIGEYTTWRNIGWGLRSGGFTVADFQNVTNNLMSEKTPQAAKAVWDDYNTAATHTPNMGTVINFLKARHGKDCLNDDITIYNAVQQLRNQSRKIENQIKKGAY